MMNTADMRASLCQDLQSLGFDCSYQSLSIFPNTADCS